MVRWIGALVLTLGVVLGVVLVGAGAAEAADGELVVSGGPHEGERAADGTTTISLTAINLGPRPMVLRLVSSSDACDDAVGEPRLAAHTTAEVTFTTVCDAGAQPRSAAVQATRPGARPAPVATVPIRFTVASTPSSHWQVLWWFLLGVPPALVLVLVPYGYWAAHPGGNQEPQPATGGSLLRRAWALGSRRLPGITEDWSLEGNWSSNITVAAGVFTALLTSTDPAEALLGDEAEARLPVVAVAAALAVALVATGPLWLVICKRRYPDDPAARHHTVAGVLVAAFVVLSASLGLVITLAAVVDRPPVTVLALAAVGLLGLYSAKSLPMTLALGASVSDQDLATEGTQGELAPARRARRRGVSGMP